MRLLELPGRYAVVRMASDAPVPDLPRGAFVSITRTADELSVVCREADAPAFGRREDGLRGVVVEGPLPFDATGILAGLLAPLAAALIPVFVVSSFDTDYVFVRERRLAEALSLWRAGGHVVSPAASPRRLAPGDWRAMPWKNGLGTTFEIARAPAGSGDDFQWRMSLADVTAAGPFSPFPGRERAIAVVAGHGMRLRHDGGDWVTLRRLQVHRFSGDASTTGELVEGAVRDFNLMWRRGEADGTLRALVLPPAGESLELSGGVALVLCLRGACSVAVLAGAWPLANEEALLWERDAPGRIGITPTGGPAEALVAELALARG